MNTDWDHDLAASFISDPLPLAPAGLAARVLQRVRRRRRQRRTVGGAALLLLVAFLTWFTFSSTLPPMPPGQPKSYDVPEHAYLQSEPPVDTLHVLGRQQAAYLTVLDQMEKEF